MVHFLLNSEENSGSLQNYSSLSLAFKELLLIRMAAQKKIV